MNRSAHFGKAVSHLLQSRVPAPPPQQQSPRRPHLHLIVARLIKYHKGTTVACFRRPKVAKHISKFKVSSWRGPTLKSTLLELQREREKETERERYRGRDRERERERQRERERVAGLILRGLSREGWWAGCNKPKPADSSSRKHWEVFWVWIAAVQAFSHSDFDIPETYQKCEFLFGLAGMLCKVWLAHTNLCPRQLHIDLAKSSGMP